MSTHKIFIGGQWRKERDLPYPSEVRRVLHKYQDQVVGAGDRRKEMWNDIFRRELGCSCEEAMRVLK